MNQAVLPDVTDLLFNKMVTPHAVEHRHRTTVSAEDSSLLDRLRVVPIPARDVTAGLRRYLPVNIGSEAGANVASS